MWTNKRINNIRDCVAQITLDHGYEMGAKCSNDILLTSKDVKVEDVIMAWQDWSKNKLSGEPVCEAERNGCWIPAIPM